ncbi:hypothetical protein ABEB36_003125 [Hypothenemus hampei]|uniref:Uncharacterized protein n=1 Tax=Hypothenemus hampei TaxID=57062 RepID=A0ABD1FB96_HYPHA
MEFPAENNHQSELKSSQESLPTRPVPRPFSIEALMSDCGPKKVPDTAVLSWNLLPNEQFRHRRDFGTIRDTDSDNSLDLELAQDLSRSRKDGKYFIYSISKYVNFWRKLFQFCTNNLWHILSVIKCYNYLSFINKKVKAIKFDISTVHRFKKQLYKLDIWVVEKHYIKIQ